MATKNDIIQGASLTGEILSLFGRRTKRNLEKAREWLKGFRTELESKLPVQFKSFKWYKRGVCYIRERSGRPKVRGELRDCLWTGMAHKKFEDPRQGIQLQFGIGKKGIRFNGIFIMGDGYATEAKNQAKASAEKNMGTFIEMLHKLGEGFYVQFDSDSDWKQIWAAGITSQEAQKLIESIGDPECYIHIDKEIKKEDAIALGDKLVEETVHTFESLLDIYSLLIGNVKTITKRHVSTRHIKEREDILKIGEASFKGMPSKQVFPPKYRRAPQHDKLREKLRAHLKDLKLEAKTLGGYGGQLDLYAKKADVGYIFEVKVIKKGNPREIYEAVGQLYWYQFYVRQKLKMKDFRLVLFTNKQPSLDTIKFLEEDRNIICLWIEGDKFGSSKLATKYPYLRDFQS